MRKILILITLLIASITAISAQIINTDHLERHIRTMASDSMQGRKTGSLEAIAAGDYIVSELEKMDIRPFSDDSYFQTLGSSQGEFMGRNIVAIIDGTDMNLREEYIIICANYDYLGYKSSGDGRVIYNGADYNASGVAAMLEAVRVLKDYPIARSILIVAFDDELQSNRGSKYFLQSKIVAPEQIKMVFNLNGVGGLKHSDLLEYSGTSYLSQPQQKIFEVSNPAMLPIKLKTKNVYMGTTSDNDPFIRAKIPEIHVSTRSRVKKEEDTIDQIDFTGLSNVTNHLISVINQSAGDAFAMIELEPIYENQKTGDKISRETTRVRFGVVLGLGTNKHNFESGPVSGRRAFSANFGFTASIPIYSVLGIKPELKVERKFAKDEGGSFYSDAISLPIDLTITLGDPYSFALVLQGGGYYNILFRGKANGDKMKFGRDAFRRHELGLRYGIGLVMSHYSLKFIGSTALSNLLTNTPYGTPKKRNQTFIIELGYRF